MINETRISKNRKAGAIILFVLVAFFYIIALGTNNWFTVYQDANEENTVEFTSTIESIQPITFFKIKTYVHKATFIIVSEEMIVNMDALNELAKDELITIHIKKCDYPDINDSEFTIDIVALRTQDKDIISFESYNAYAKERRIGLTIATCVWGTIFVVAGLVCVLWRRNATINQQGEKILFQEYASQRRTLVKVLTALMFSAIGITLIIGIVTYFVRGKIPDFTTSELGYLAFVALCATTCFITTRKSKHLNQGFTITENEFHFNSFEQQASKYNTKDLKSFEVLTDNTASTEFQLYFYNGESIAITTRKANELRKTLTFLVENNHNNDLSRNSF